MKRYTILFVTLIISSTLYAQQVLKRTFSTNPSTDLFKSALQRGDLEAVQEHMYALPIGIDYQYAYLGLAGSAQMNNYLLEALYAHWIDRITHSPHDALVCLSVGLERLYKSYSLDSLDHGFRCMLAKIRREASLLPFDGDAELQELVHTIPQYADEDNLEMAIAYGASFQTTQRGDLLVELSKVHHAPAVAFQLQREAH